MANKPAVSGVDAGVMAGQKYGLYLASVGFETRARFYAEQYRPNAKLKYAIGFNQRHKLNYQANLEWFKSAGYATPVASDEDYSAMCMNLFEESDLSDGELRVCADISSLSRLRIAMLVHAAARFSEKRPISVDFVYCAAAYQEPTSDSSANVTLGPILPEFAGWSSHPHLPSAVVVGIGYTKGRAIGAIEYIDPAEIWVLRPEGIDDRYDVGVQAGNDSLWAQVRAERILRYPVDQPIVCFARLESLVFGLRQRCRPVLLAFGPKVFALCSVLVATWHRVPVWRVSSNNNSDPKDQVASGKVSRLRATFSSAAR